MHAHDPYFELSPKLAEKLEKTKLTMKAADFIEFLGFFLLSCFGAVTLFLWNDPAFREGIPIFGALALLGAALGIYGVRTELLYRRQKKERRESDISISPICAKEMQAMSSGLMTLPKPKRSELRELWNKSLAANALLLESANSPELIRFIRERSSIVDAIVKEHSSFNAEEKASLLASLKADREEQARTRALSLIESLGDEDVKNAKHDLEALRTGKQQFRELGPIVRS